jgi:signal transduction histidine kinase
MLVSKKHLFSSPLLARSPALISALLATIITFLGFIVLYGWYQHQLTLIQVHPAFVPMQYNTALGFLLSGIALLSALLRWQRCAIFCAISVSLIGGLTLVEYITQIDLAIDQLFMQHYITTLTSNPGRMAPNTALCFFLSGLIFLTVSIKTKAYLFSLLGAIVTGLGLIAFLGYLTGLETAYGWGQLTRMAVHTSLGFVLLGLGISLWGLSIAPKVKKTAQYWIRTSTSMVLIVLVLALWQSLTSWENKQIKKNVSNQLNNFNSTFEQKLNAQIKALKRMAQRWNYRQGTPYQEWQQDAQQYIKDLPFYQSIEWVDKSLTVRWVAPLKGNESATNLALDIDTQQLRLLNTAIKNRESAITRTLSTKHGDAGFLIYVPLFVKQNFNGFIRGVFHVDNNLSLLLQQNSRFQQNYQLQIYDNKQLIIGKVDSSKETSSYQVKKTLHLKNLRWQATLSPSPKLLQELQSPLPHLVLFSGLLLISLLQYFYYLRGREQEKSILLQQEIHKREQNEQVIARYTHELERSNKELNDFAYVASHDLKAPLRGLMQLASWIEEDLKDNIEQQTQEYLTLMQNRITRLEKLLNDLLAYSRIGRKHGGFKIVDITTLVKDIFQLLEPPATFKLVCQQPLPSLVTLSVPLEQIFRNLLNNAIKHHDKSQATIVVSAQVNENKINFTVADDGSGIAPAQHERVFRIFQTLKPRDEVEGSGMGLAIVKKLLDSYQSQISIESDGIRGTKVHFSWPTENNLRKLVDE